jgi:hypothetical protein
MREQEQNWLIFASPLDLAEASLQLILRLDVSVVSAITTSHSGPESSIGL